uniref:Uncharacterized protein n=1 Tax=Opuntia streptacantha TaxID=393608 RepID=A0A7C9DA07_OPUST
MRASAPNPYTRLLLFRFASTQGSRLEVEGPVLFQLWKVGSFCTLPTSLYTPPDRAPPSATRRRPYANSPGHSPIQDLTHEPAPTRPSSQFLFVPQHRRRHLPCRRALPPDPPTRKHHNQFPTLNVLGFPGKN